jgi:hypothetical protein
MITYGTEKLEQFKRQAIELIALHWDEVAHDKEVRDLDVDWDSFEALEKAGQLYILTARDDGELIGYVAAILRPHFHSKKTRSAYVDAIFLSKNARKNNVGIRLIQMTDTALSGLADFVYWHIKPEKNFAPILKRIGYHFIEEIWGRASHR